MYIFGDTIVKNNNLEYLMYSNYFNNKCVQMPFCHQSSMVKTNILKSINVIVGKQIDRTKETKKSINLLHEVRNLQY